LDAILPHIAEAGAVAGRLTEAGARLLDPSGRLTPGIPFCPPEGDAGTGMIATNAVRPRTGNISAGTSIFAMIVLDHELARLHPEIDMVTTPAGSPVALVHSNNGASEIDAWAGVFAQFAARAGTPLDTKAVFATLFGAALEGEADGGGLLAYNYLAGEHLTGIPEGRPVIVRTPESHLTLATFARTLLMSSFCTLSLGMRILASENAVVDSMFAHGGIFATKGVAQRLLAAAINTPVVVGATASEGGAWGMAVLAAYTADNHGYALADFLDEVVFASAEVTTVTPDPADVAGYERFLAAYERGLAIERTAITAC
jgi:sugar (pentulose or hexulose) kinase